MREEFLNDCVCGGRVLLRFLVITHPVSSPLIGDGIV